MFVKDIKFSQKMIRKGQLRIENKSFKVLKNRTVTQIKTN